MFSFRQQSELQLRWTPKDEVIGGGSKYPQCLDITGNHPQCYVTIHKSKSVYNYDDDLGFAR